MNKIYINMKFDKFSDLFSHICKELNRMDCDGEEPDDEGDTDFYEWVEQSLSDETKEAMVSGELSGLTPASYAHVIDDSFTYCQAYPGTDFDAVFRQRAGIQKRADDMIRKKWL